MIQRMAGRFFIALLIFLPFFRPLMVRAEEGPNLVIGEVAWAGSSVSSADEWLEIWNRSNEPVPLDGYSLSGASAEPIVFDETQVLQPQSAFLIANYSADEEKSALANEPDLVTTAVSLSNSSLKIELVAPDGIVIDSAGDGSAPPAGSASQRASMQRDASGEWVTADASEGFDSEMTDLGTPGVCDACEAVNAPEEAAMLPSQTETPVPEPVEEPIVASEASTSTAEEVSSEETSLSEEPASTEASPPEAETMPEATVTQTDTPASTEGTTAQEGTETPETPTIITAASTEEAGPQYPKVVLKIAGGMQAESAITFDASSSSDPNGDIVYFLWDFGDGETATGSVMTHTYATSGRFLFQLIATDTTFRSYATGTLDIAPKPLPPPSMLLNEIHPAPLDGPEWVELYAPDLTSLDQLDGWQLEDATGVIFRFQEKTSDSIRHSNAFLLIQLSSSRLNNSGDQVILMDAAGNTIDAIEYPKTTKGQSWIRFPDGNADWRAGRMTPMAKNQLEEPSKKTAVSPPAASIEISKPEKPSTDTSIIVAKTFESEKSANSKTNTPQPPASMPVPKITNATSATAKTAAKKTPTKTTTKKSAPEPVSIPLSMASTLPPNILVRISGVVGTKPGILAKHQYVLLSEDGHGILVKGTNKQPSPDFLSFVSLTGTLKLNDDGLYIQMGTNDRWEKSNGTGTPLPRTVNLMDPQTEDGWSLVQIRGSIVEAKATTVLLEVDGLPLEIMLRTPVKYRGSRLNPGDIVDVQGLLDTQNDDLRLYPRDANEITLVSVPAAEKKPAANPMPDWTPIGAAGFTVAAAEGVKRLRKWRREKKVQSLIEKAKASS